MKIALFGSLFDEKSDEYENQFYVICQKIINHQIDLYLPDTLFNSFSESLKRKIKSFITVYGTSFPKVDLAFSIGGDGTFLRTTASIAHHKTPILGINTGRLGFLADIKLEDLDETLEEIFNNNYRIEMRMLLKTVGKKSNINNGFVSYSLNEVAVLKQDTASMLTIHAFIDDEYLTSYQADGLVIATPTGSTAYSLSIGGPIMVPTAPNIILTAIAPHSLNARPLVVDSNSKISLKVESRSSNYLVSLDGESQILNVGTLLEITKADYAQPVVKRCGHTFYETLRNKLMWGVDIRSSEFTK
ncbi:MAG: NAD kinase [Dysgonamonadaceae bacterium]|nr:NAD kinase [Dysgonamonadaceae bacterium]